MSPIYGKVTQSSTRYVSPSEGFPPPSTEIFRFHGNDLCEISCDWYLSWGIRYYYNRVQEIKFIWNINIWLSIFSIFSQFRIDYIDVLWENKVKSLVLIQISRCNCSTILNIRNKGFYSKNGIPSRETNLFARPTFAYLSVWWWPAFALNSPHSPHFKLRYLLPWHTDWSLKTRVLKTVDCGPETEDLKTGT